jgi:hypothetical protein
MIQTMVRQIYPTKTNIVYFNTRDIPPGLFFWIENTRMYPVKCHKHLGITLSADCKRINLPNHCLDHSEICFKSVFTMLHKLYIS